jgi:hypothetical protein
MMEQRDIQRRMVYAIPKWRHMKRLVLSVKVLVEDCVLLKKFILILKYVVELDVVIIISLHGYLTIVVERRHVKSTTRTIAVMIHVVVVELVVIWVCFHTNVYVILDIRVVV